MNVKMQAVDPELQEMENNIACNYRIFSNLIRTLFTVSEG